MTSQRVVFRVEPEDSEDIFGYLMRVAEVNSFVGLGGVLKAVLGGNITSITPADIPALSYFCRLYPEEMVHFSGISSRGAAGSRSWQVHRQWVTKEPFLASRKAKICTRCLRESLYIRGMWDLSFYTACTRHRALLIDRCPSCRRRLKWNRRSVGYCQCGCDLAIASCGEPSEPSLVVSCLIEHQCGCAVDEKIHNAISPSVFSELSDLSLDGLCKILWFVGHCLCEIGQCGPAHGRYKPVISDAGGILWKAFSVFEQWPIRMGEILEHVFSSRAFDDNPIFSPISCLGPLEGYLRDELQDDQFLFVTVPYERYLDSILRALGRQHRKRKLVRQMEFYF